MTVQDYFTPTIIDLEKCAFYNKDLDRLVFIGYHDCKYRSYVFCGNNLNLTWYTNNTVKNLKEKASFEALLGDDLANWQIISSKQVMLELL